VNGEQNITAIVAEYENRLLQYVGQLIGPGAEEAQDVVQDTFLRLHRQYKKHGYNSIKSLSSWLYRVAHNLAMDAGRRRKRQKKLQEKVMLDPITNLNKDTKKNPENIFSHKEMCTIAMNHLQELPEEQKNILLLKIIEGFTLQHISELTGIKIGTVNYRLSQGLTALSGKLKKVGVL